MARVKRGVTSHARHKKVLKAAKGYYGRRKNTIRIAKQAVERANQYAYRDRKRKKRTFRALWIQRLNAAVRPFGLTYSRFIDGLGKAGVAVDRKVLSDLAIREPAAFEAIVGQAKAARGRDSGLDVVQTLVGLQQACGGRAIEQAGVEMRQAVVRRQAPGDRALARSGRTVDGDDHGSAAPRRCINSTNPGKLVAMKLASSTFTGLSLANPMTSAAMAMR